jgi:hypothetical protein
MQFVAQWPDESQSCRQRVDPTLKKFNEIYCIYCIDAFSFTFTLYDVRPKLTFATTSRRMARTRVREVKMACKSCKLENQYNFNSEIAIHFPGLKGLDKPAVLVFPPVTICLRCGYAEFAVHGEPLEQLRNNSTDSMAS